MDGSERGALTEIDANVPGLRPIGLSWRDTGVAVCPSSRQRPLWDGARDSHIQSQPGGVREVASTVRDRLLHRTVIIQLAKASDW